MILETNNHCQCTCEAVLLYFWHNLSSFIVQYIEYINVLRYVVMVPNINVLHINHSQQYIYCIVQTLIND